MAGQGFSQWSDGEGDTNVSNGSIKLFKEQFTFGG